jgi:hypothetical protein
VSQGATIGLELPACGQGHKIESGSVPSTVRVDSSTLVAAFRSGSRSAKGHQADRIDITSAFGIHKSQFQNSVAADVSRRKLKEMARTHVHGHRVLKEPHKTFGGFRIPLNGRPE